MSVFDFRAVFGASLVPGVVVLEVQDGVLVAVSGQTAGVSYFQLAEGEVPALIGQTEVSETYPEFVPSDGSIFDDGTLWLWDHLQGRAIAAADGELSVTQTESGALEISHAAQSGSHTVAVALPDEQLAIIAEQFDGAFDILDSVVDTSKTTISNVSDLLAVIVDDSEYLIASSFEESGLTCFAFNDGELIVADTIGAKDGFWVSGVTALKACEVQNETFILALSSESDSIVALRLNDHGVFFPADQLWDSLETRFQGAVDFEVFEWNARSFIVVGGQDSGLSLVEVLPEGVLFHHGAIAQSAEWNMGPVTEIAVEVVGSKAQIFVTGTNSDGIAQLSIELERIGPRIAGTNGDDTLKVGWMDDAVFGRSGDDHLIGQSGDDVLVDGPGSDRLSGGDGADIFILVADGDVDRIEDFNLGLDKIDLSDWGRIYAVEALNISETTWGAEIKWGDELLKVYANNSSPIEVADWSADDFIF